MAWTIDYTDTAKQQLRKLDKHMARRIVDFMDERIAGLENPRSSGKALTGPLGGFWRYRVGDFRVVCDIQDRRFARPCSACWSPGRDLPIGWADQNATALPVLRSAIWWCLLMSAAA